MKQAEEIRHYIKQSEQQMPKLNFADRALKPQQPKAQMAENERRAAIIRSRHQQAEHKVVTSGTYLEKKDTYPEALPDVSVNRLQKMQKTKAAQETAKKEIEQQYQQFAKKWQKQQQSRAQS